VTGERSLWPPDGFGNPDALADCYNAVYEEWACEKGFSPTEAHQHACEAIHREGYMHATGGCELHPALVELVESVQELFKQGAHDGPCDNEDPDDACELHIETAERRRQRAIVALMNFERHRPEYRSKHFCTCTDGSCAEDRPEGEA
jgi:hypothetical protein